MKVAIISFKFRPNMKIFKAIPKAGFYLVIMAVVLFELGVLFKFVPQQWQEIAQLLQSKKVAGDQVTALNKALTVLKSVDQKELARQLAVVNAALPSQKKTSGLVAGLTNMTQASGVNFIQIDFSPGLISTTSAVESAIEVVIPGTRVHRLDATLGISTDLTQLVTFLKQIQKASQLLGTSQVSFVGGTARRQTAQLTLQVYYQPEEGGETDWGSLRAVSADEQKVIQALSARDVFTLPEEQR